LKIRKDDKMDELERIVKVYDQRGYDDKEYKYSMFNPAQQYTFLKREMDVLKMLGKEGCTDYSNSVILDVGCGKGGRLFMFMLMGSSPENLYGVDLSPERVKQSRERFPNFEYKCESAHDLSFPDEKFDYVICSLMFTNILSEKLCKDIGKELLRILKPRGYVIFYDLCVNNPKNKDIRAIRKKEIYEVFPNCKINIKRISLAPPLVRLLAPYSWFICHLLEKIPFLCCHNLALIRKA
jgi:ubiquinone/menaquinone biosynthesis C-methylase UbiE